MLNKIFRVIFYTSLCFIAALLIFLIVEYCKVCERTKEQNWKLREENRTYIEQLPSCQRYNLFQEVVFKIARREYSKDYNCLNFAKDLQQELKKIDIKSTILINRDRTHAWLSVWIEPRTGLFIEPNSNYQVGEIRNDKLNIICNCQ